MFIDCLISSGLERDTVRRKIAKLGNRVNFVYATIKHPERRHERPRSMIIDALVFFLVHSRYIHSERR
jgi:hypothetical protein